jgi:hypothetical protein
MAANAVSRQTTGSWCPVLRPPPMTTDDRIIARLIAEGIDVDLVAD